MTLMKSVGLALILAVHASSALADKFDLSCSGKFVSLGTAGASEKPWTDRIRVDADAAKWCRGECVRITPIYAVTDSEYEFNRVRDNTMAMRLTVNRRTGELFETLSLNDGLVKLTTTTTAVCTREPHSGFPPPKF